MSIALARTSRSEIPGFDDRRATSSVPGALPPIVSPIATDLTGAGVFQGDIAASPARVGGSAADAAAVQADRTGFHGRRIRRILTPHHDRGATMTLCPIAIVAGCKKCPAYSVCPLKTVIGDAPRSTDAKAAEPKKK
jgi:hypothetical protein